MVILLINLITSTMLFQLFYSRILLFLFDLISNIITIIINKNKVRPPQVIVMYSKLVLQGYLIRSRFFCLYQDSFLLLTKDWSDVHFVFYIMKFRRSLFKKDLFTFLTHTNSFLKPKGQRPLN